MSWWSRAWRQDALERQLDAELRDHVERLVADHLAAGLSGADARRRARMEFGGFDQAKEACRDVRGLRWLDELTQDVRGAVRILRATPVVSAAAILSLALGIGANTALFSLVNRLVLRTLPVAEPQHLFTIESGQAINAGDGPRWSTAFWSEVHQQADLFAGMAAWSVTRLNVGEGSDVDPVDGLLASGDFYATLGVPVALGRTFTLADDVRNGGREGPVAVLSYAFWQRRFGGAPDVIGTPLTVEHTPFTIVGVAAKTFTGVEAGRGFDIAVPIGTEPLIRDRQSFLSPPFDRFNYWLLVVLRLKPGQSVDAATAALRAWQPQIRDRSVPQEFPQLRDTYLKEPFTLVPAGGGFSRLRQLYQRPLLTIFAVVAFVLLIACANIANLLLARAAARQHEWSVRLALGASRGRLARQLLVESLVLAAIGAAAGLLAARWGSDALVRQLSTSTTPVVLNMSLDWRVLTFTGGVMIATALLFGTAPAFRAARVPPIGALKEQGRATSVLSRASLSNALVVLQVALSLALVVGAGLLVGTFERLAHVPLGFDSRRVLLVTADATRTAIAQADRRDFYGRMVSELSAMPDVASAAGSVATPAGSTNLFPIWVESVNGSPVAGAAGQSSKANFITPRWFATYGTPLRGGRDFDEHDLSSAARVVIVNEAFARQFFPDGHAIGNAIGLAFGGHGEIPGGAKTVVGVAANAVADSLRQPPPPTVYTAAGAMGLSHSADVVDRHRGPSSCWSAFCHSAARQRDADESGQPSSASNAAARGSDRRVTGAGTHGRAAIRLLRRSGTVAGRSRPLWCDGVCHHPPARGDGDPHGAGRVSSERGVARPVACRARGRRRCRRGSGRQPLALAIPGGAALWHRAQRSATPGWRDRGFGRRIHVRRLAAGAARVAH